MEIGMVTYGHLEGFENGLNRVQKSFQNAHILVVNNRPNSAKMSELQGTNTHFEFSGYLQVCEYFTGSGPFVIVNDTLFKTHYTAGWLQLLKRAIYKLDTKADVVYGDIRWDGKAYSERPHPFLASWLFVLPNVRSLQLFKQSLSAILTEETPVGSAEYQRFLHQWISPKGKLNGWHGGAKDDESRARKERCIRLEHRFSTVMPQYKLPLTSLGVFSPFFYSIVRGLDRIKTRFAASLT